MLNKLPFLDDIGKATRSKRNTKLENFLTEMQRMTLVHEQGIDGGEYYRFAPGASKSPGDNGDEPHKAKGAETQQAKSQAKKSDKSEAGGDAAGANGETNTKDTGSGKKDV